MTPEKQQPTVSAALERLIEDYEFRCRTSVPGGRELRPFEKNIVAAARSEHARLQGYRNDSAKIELKLHAEKAALIKQLDALLNHCDKEGGECSVCSKIICPYGDEMHFHHDGCPSCYVEAEKAKALFSKHGGSHEQD